ncbi:uncharacterized protein LOC143422672 [Xylocopa sonorina]|uniref:uncharacterized protein LOC143422672 n=1 Tax=Xylocopa sonorina TaxID=1818115 RepID=UPI00403AC225
MNYCDISSFDIHYSHLYGWILFVICVVGIIMNTVNIFVLNRREMRSPASLTVTGVAVANLLLIIEYIPNAIRLSLYQLSKREDIFSYESAVFVHFHLLFTQVINLIIFTLGNTTIEPRYFVQLTKMAENHRVLKYIYFWNSNLIKYSPYIVLMVIFVQLLQVLLKPRNQNIRNQNLNPRGFEIINRRDQPGQTIKMFLIVLFLFLSTELPQQVLGLVNVIHDRGFSKTCHLMLVDVGDILSLVSSAISVSLFCLTNSQFRATFKTFIFGERELPANNREVQMEIHK